MKWRCPFCKKIIVRRMSKITRSFMTPKGWYRSMCDKTGKDAFCRPITKEIKRRTK